MRIKTLLIAFFLTGNLRGLTQSVSLDSTFENDGIVITGIGSYASASSVIMQPDGKVIIAGGAQIGIGYGEVAIIRLKTNGDKDTSFGTNGIATTGYNPN